MKPIDHLKIQEAAPASFAYTPFDISLQRDWNKDRNDNENVLPWTHAISARLNQPRANNNVNTKMEKKKSIRLIIFQYLNENKIIIKILIENCL